MAPDHDNILKVPDKGADKTNKPDSKVSDRIPTFYTKID